jgi:hypothetical protein
LPSWRARRWCSSRTPRELPVSRRLAVSHCCLARAVAGMRGGRVATCWRLPRPRSPVPLLCCPLHHPCCPEQRGLSRHM